MWFFRHLPLLRKKGWKMLPVDVIRNVRKFIKQLCPELYKLSSYHDMDKDFIEVLSYGIKLPWKEELDEDIYKEFKNENIEDTIVDGLKKYFVEFFSEFQKFDEIEDFLLNQQSQPKYTAKFTYPDYNSNGKYTQYTKNLTWPLGGFWNLAIEGTRFDNYVNQLQLVSEKLDEYKTNLISRFLVTGSIKEFDTSDQKIEKILQIYDKSCDGMSFLTI